LAAIGAPVGGLLVQWSFGSDPMSSLHSNPELYAYMLFGTQFIFMLFGYYVGRQEEFAESLSLRDSLTGLYNRRYFRLRLEEEALGASRHHDPVMLALFDLDCFKHINDKYGHPVGDELLKAIACIAQQVLRRNYILARLGGDEFAILFPQCSPQRALLIAERLRLTIKNEGIKTLDGNRVNITISVGLGAQLAQESLSAFYDRVDKALYVAKAQGRDRVVNS